jgi:capsular exopolysaccharide synthesis family protein
MSTLDLTGLEGNGLRGAGITRLPGPDELGPEPPFRTVNLREVAAVLRRNIWLVLFITASTVGATLYVASRRQPEYRAAGLIRITDKQRALTSGIAATQVASGDLILSQLEVLKGRVVMGEVVDRTGLRLSSATEGFSRRELQDLSVKVPADSALTLTLDFAADGFTVDAGAKSVRARYGSPVEIGGVRFVVAQRPRVEGAQLSVGPREATIGALIGELRAQPHSGTDAVDIQYTSTDRYLAREVVNAAIDVFQHESATSSQEQSRRRRIFVEDQLRHVDSTLAVMQVALGEFRSREQVYSSRDKFAAEQQSLMKLGVEYAELTANRRLYQSVLDGFAAQQPAARSVALQRLASSPDLASNPVVAQLYEQLNQYEAARDSITTGDLGVTARHPDVQRYDTLIAVSRNKLGVALRNQVAALDAKIEAIGALQSQSAAEIQKLPTTETEEVRLVQQVESTTKLGDELRAELQKARIAEAVETGPVDLVYAAPVPDSPIGGNTNRQLGLALVFGLALGGGGAFLREHLNTSIRRREDVEELLRIPELAVIPKLEGMPSRGVHRYLPGTPIRARRYPVGNRELVTLTDVRSTGAEAYRMLRTNLLFTQAVNTLRTLAITSAVPGEGKTTTAANLAISCAQQGMKILLVDCDLRRSRLHRLFNVASTPGLTGLLLGQCTPAEALRATRVEGLTVLPSGVLPPNPGEILGGARMKRALDAFSTAFDLVVMDTPPLRAAADAAILGGRVDGVALVVRAGETDRAAALYSVQQLEGVGARVLGAILNDPDAKVPQYGDYYYYYDYYGAV